MIEPVPTPTENPRLSMRALSHPRGTRRPLLVLGDLDTSARGWGRVAAALESKRYYLGPVLGGDLDQVLPDLLHWRFRAVMLDIAGILVPRWQHLPHEQQDRLRVLGSHWPSGGRDDKPARFLPIDGESLQLPVFFEQSSHLRLVGSRLSGGWSTSSLLADLALHIPTDTDLVEGLKHHAWGQAPADLRGFDAAQRAAARLSTSGCTGREIGRYLAAYGYENAKGVIGSWNYERLTEALPASHDA
jgi:hypothetical protein